MQYEINDLARKYAPWSISKAGLAEICPLQFKFKHIDKVKDGIVTPSDNKVGTCSHKVLELRVGGTPASEARKLAFDETPLTTNEMEHFRTLEDNIEDFLRRFDTFCQQAQPKKILLEEEWAFTADFRPTGFFADDVFFRGKVDLGLITKDDDLIVIDHKSGQAKDITRDQKFKKQLNSYKVMGLANIAGLAGARSAIHFMLGNPDNRIQWLPYVDRRYIETTLVPWLFEYINFCAEKFVEPWVAKPKPRWPCAWCPFTPVCNAYNEMMRAAQI